MIDLRPFSGVNDVRFYINQPVCLDGATYATNGHILIRVDEPSDYKEYPEPVAQKSYNAFRRIIKETHEDGRVFTPLSIELPPAEPCTWCNGTGEEEDENGDLDICSACDGYLESTQQHIDIGRAGFARRYLKLLLPLPNIEFSAAGPKEPAAFRFTGGVGTLMPVHK